MGNLRSAILVSTVALLAGAPAGAAVTAFRMTTLALRDPHVDVNFLGCRDLTDNALAGFSFNGQIQSELNSDADGDGALDLSPLLVLSPLDPSAATGSLLFLDGSCVAPSAGTHCAPGTGVPVSFALVNQASGACLAPIAGTTSSYSPGIASPNGGCFSSDAQTISLPVLGVPLTLHSARIGASYSGAPAANLVSGLLMGFVTEADANATTFPASVSLIGGHTLASVLPGGSGCCATHSDKDVMGGVQGWWMYFNFSATAVPYDDGTTAVPTAALAGRLGEARPNPFREGVTLDYSLPVASVVRIWVSDPAGRRIAALAGGIESAGSHSLTWDGHSAAGARLPAGLYLIRAELGGRSSVRRVALVR